MCNLLQVRWTITPRTEPQPWIICGGCGEPRPFRSSGKVRLNANGRRLDAWLIYKCTVCDRTWNRPIFERQNVRDISPAVLEALRANDPEWVRAEAFNLAALQRKTRRIDESDEIDIERTVLSEAPAFTRVEILLSAPLPVSQRLDRLLASALDISRSQLKALWENGVLRAEPARADRLRRRISDGTRITIVPTFDAGQREFWLARATGTSPPAKA
ncbi:DUF1062 domain-containing protein [Martelella endophytica]|uniref:DUF1062 domain-containing protein n=1 Tax=Martelella endophytica TaxID=1486262 RepID=A0A0D5LM78_MAREN|nr:DUF1062 domain-containing protein [Martelella endophytica]AJY45271.1 hypothetical protein TM49_05470 [Martelella endophytica]